MGRFSRAFNAFFRKDPGLNLTAEGRSLGSLSAQRKKLVNKQLKDTMEEIEVLQMKKTLRDLKEDLSEASGDPSSDVLETVQELLEDRAEAGGDTWDKIAGVFVKVLEKNPDMLNQFIGQLGGKPAGEVSAAQPVAQPDAGITVIPDSPELTVKMDADLKILSAEYKLGIKTMGKPMFLGYMSRLFDRNVETLK